jgi:hypothetical protein
MLGFAALFVGAAFFSLDTAAGDLACAPGLDDLGIVLVCWLAGSVGFFAGVVWCARPR